MAARWPALHHSAYRRLLFTRFATTLAVHAQAVALGWHIYSTSRSALDLALIGLVQFLPGFLLLMVTGTVADHFSRPKVMTICLLIMVSASAGMIAALAYEVTPTAAYLGILAIFSTARAFLNPAQQSLVSNVVPPQDLSNAVATNSIATRTAQALGPMIGGFLYAIYPVLAISAVCLILLASALIARVIVVEGPPPGSKRLSWQAVSAGFRYIWATPPILGAVTLDVMVVVFGSVTALLPILAYDVLQAGPEGLGLLRASPAIGGILAAVYFGLYSVQRRVGVVMLSMVGFFGAATIVLGVSQVMWLSCLALFVMGASDMASVFIRWTLIQLWTPDEVRGRVTAVTSVASQGSNDLGDFRAGLLAAAIGAGPAIIGGGMLVVLVVAAWTRLFPQLAQISDFEQANGKPL